MHLFSKIACMVKNYFMCEYDTWLKHNCSRRIRDELAKQNEETTELTTKLDKVSCSEPRLHICGIIVYTGDLSNALLLFAGNSLAEGPVGGSKVWCYQILHRYHCFDISCRACRSPHRYVNQANTFFHLPKFIGGNPLEEDRFWFCS